jgi:hypothetical protein
MSSRSKKRNKPGKQGAGHYHTEGSGHLYQGRFKTFPIEEDQHLLTVLRYVERNPLRASLVRTYTQCFYRWVLSFPSDFNPGSLVPAALFLENSYRNSKCREAVGPEALESLHRSPTRTTVSCGGVIDRGHFALAKAAYLRYQSDGAQWLCPGPWLHLPCALRSNRHWSRTTSASAHRTRPPAAQTDRARNTRLSSD